MIDLSSAAGRQKLAGIHRFLSEGYDWDMELVRTRDELTRERIVDAAKNRVDGFFMAIPEPHDLQRLHRELGIPTAFIDYPDDQTLREFYQCVFVMEDTREICRTAARSILSSGVYKTYAYVEAASAPRWSRERGDMFAKELAKKGLQALRITADEVASPDRLVARLLDIEKPAAILAAYDDTARTVLSACKRAGLKTPGDVAVLGIGDDEDVCAHATPTISSVKPDFEEEGYRAARELQSMMMGRANPARRTFLCGGTQVVERDSTRHAAKADAMVHDALAYIAGNALRGIFARDVARHLHVSRRLADYRFRKATGTSMQQAIIERRLKEVCRLLSESTLSISEVAVRCGYADANYLKNLFKKRFSTSMRDWRRKISSAP